MNKCGFRACLLLGGVAVAATAEIWTDVLKDANGQQAMWIVEVLHEKFKFFMEIEVRDSKTDVYVMRKVYEAFDEIKIRRLLPDGHPIYGRTKEILMAITFVAFPLLTIRFPNMILTKQETTQLCSHLKEVLHAEILSWWDTTIYEKTPIILSVPYCKWGGEITKKFKEIGKCYGVGHTLCGIDSKTTHFNRSPAGVLHFSVNVEWLKKLETYIVKCALNGNFSFFNEFSHNRTFTFFIECDSEPIQKTAQQFGIAIQSALYELSENKEIPPLEPKYLQCTLFDASNESKTSVHVRFPELHVSRETAVLLTHKLKKCVSDPQIKKSIDAAPVSGGVVQLRMPFCDKPNKNGTRANRPLIYKGALEYPYIVNPPVERSAICAVILRRSSLHSENEMAKVQNSSALNCDKRLSSVYTFSKLVVPDDGDVRVLGSVEDELYEFSRDNLKCILFASNKTETV